MFGFATHRNKKHLYCCITKDNQSGNLYAPDHAAIDALFPIRTQKPMENMYRIPINQADELVEKMRAAGWEENNSHAQGIIDYCKEEGRLR